MKETRRLAWLRQLVGKGGICNTEAVFGVIDMSCVKKRL